MKVGIFMPGRLQSERLPNKLILDFNNNTIWEIACERLSKIKNVEKCVLISFEDDYTLGEIARKYDLNIIYRDPDTTKVDGPLNYVFKDIKLMEADIVMFLNPCLPMLKVETVQEVIDRIITEKIEFGESVKEFNNWLFEHYGKYIITPEFDKMSTKSLKLYYQPAHAFRVFDKNYFLETGDMSIEFFPTLFPISEEESVDIDTELDFKIAKVIYNERKINKKI